MPSTLKRSGVIEETYLLLSSAKEKALKRQNKIRVGGRTSIELPANLAEGGEFAFIESVTVRPVQNPSNHAKSIRRLDVRRSIWGAHTIDVLSKGDQVRTRISIGARIVVYTIEASSAPAKVLTVSDAFQCWGLAAGPGGPVATTFTLPEGTLQLVGVSFYFAKRSVAADQVLTIEANAADKIQVRVKKPGMANPVVIAQRIRSDVQNNARSSVVVTLREKGLWVVENPSLVDADTSNWTNVP
jgi:hypothetical protein